MARAWRRDLGCTKFPYTFESYRNCTASGSKAKSCWNTAGACTPSVQYFGGASTRRQLCFITLNCGQRTYIVRTCARYIRVNYSWLSDSPSILPLYSKQPQNCSLYSGLNDICRCLIYINCDARMPDGKIASTFSTLTLFLIMATASSIPCPPFPILFLCTSLSQILPVLHLISNTNPSTFTTTLAKNYADYRHLSQD